MAITTKTGDRGTTQLLWGKKVSKDNLRVEIYGTLDELCSFLGMPKAIIKDSKIRRIIESVQRDLFTLGAEIATESGLLKKLKKRIQAQDVKRLERVIDELEKAKALEECCFYLPGENLASASFDIARTVCRRAERIVVTYRRKGLLKNPPILIYLNRLSDLLFLLARAQGKKHKKLTPQL